MGLIMEYKRILKDGTHLLIGKAATAAITLIQLMILARILTTEEMGKYSLVLMTVNLALLIGFNWSDASIVRHGREEYINTKKINQSFWARMYLFLPIMAIFIILFAALNRQVTEYLGMERNAIITIIIMFILNAVLNFIMYIFQSMDQMKKSAYVLFYQKAFYLAFLGLILLNIIQTNLSNILIIINISFLISIIINIYLLDFHTVRPYAFNKDYFRKIWSYSWPQLLGFPGIYIINYIDIFVIKKYMTLADVGTYSLAYNIFMNLCNFIMIIHIVMFPAIVEYRTRKNGDAIHKYLKKIPLLSIIWLACVIFGIGISSFVIPALFSAKYAASALPLNILLIASVFYFISVCVMPIINAFDYLLAFQVINLIRAGVNIILDFSLVPKLGIMGAAYGTLATYFVGFLLTIAYIYLKRDAFLRMKHD